MSEFDGDVGMRWRLILTDTELPTGVAPVCPQPEVHGAMHGGPADDMELYDECCAVIGPHLQCWTENNARELMSMLNRLGVELCD